MNWPNQRMEWTITQVNFLKSCWLEGDSASAIARKMQSQWHEARVTRNMVIGKARRLGLPGRPSPIKRKQKPVNVDITARCVWPIGHPDEPDFHYCAAERVNGKPYCEEHCRKAYIKAPKGEVPAQRFAIGF